jgi:hypothetical protein
MVLGESNGKARAARSSLLKVPVATVGEALRMRWCKGVLVLMVALVKALVVAPALGAQMVLRFDCACNASLSVRPTWTCEVWMQLWMT